MPLPAATPRRWLSVALDFDLEYDEGEFDDEDFYEEDFDDEFDDEDDGLNYF